jgi:hypothetical protein
MTQYPFTLNESQITEIPSDILNPYKPGNFSYEQAEPERRDVPLKMWYVDDIFNDPDSVYEMFKEQIPQAGQFNTGTNSNDPRGIRNKNLQDFDDKRLEFPARSKDRPFKELKQALIDRFISNEVWNQLEEKGEEYDWTPRDAYTNTFRMYAESDFNKWNENYWWPHTDKHNHYACLIYMNKNGCDGTNIYKKAREDVKDTHDEGGEHVTSWRSKKDWDLLFKSESKYNRIFIFPGHIWHGMAHNTDKYISNEKDRDSEYRNNLAIFI